MKFNFLKKHKQSILITLLLFLLMLPNIIALFILDTEIIDIKKFYSSYFSKIRYFLVSLGFLIVPFLFIKKVKTYFLLGFLIIPIACLEILHIIILKDPILTGSISSFLSASKNEMIDLMEKEIKILFCLLIYIILYFVLYLKISSKIKILRRKLLITVFFCTVIYGTIFHTVLDLANIRYQGDSLSKSFGSSFFDKNQS